MEGMFIVLKKIFGIHFKRIYPSVWHKTVQVYQVFDERDQLKGYIYFDLYTRKHKREGAWMQDVRTRRVLEDGGIQYPVAFITCNIMKISHKHTMLTHDEICTLFHEMGHALHHVLTTINVPKVSGIYGIPWDAIEVPSQVFENLCWDKEILQLCSRHYKTNKKLPVKVFHKLIKARKLFSGMAMMRQLAFSLFDFRIHLEYKKNKKQFVDKILYEVKSQTSLLAPLPFDKFQNFFSHIFSGGYAAGYYSYKWSEMLALDIFDKFEKNGELNTKVGRMFLTDILEKGGSIPFMKLFVKFRKRKPKMEPLLKHIIFSEDDYYKKPRNNYYA